MNADNKSPLQSTSGSGLGGAQLASLKPKEQGNRPAKIDEGQEPPHDTVLPA